MLDTYSLQEVIGLTLNSSKHLLYVVMLASKKYGNKKKVMCTVKDMKAIDEKLKSKHRLSFLTQFVASRTQ